MTENTPGVDPIAQSGIEEADDLSSLHSQMNGDDDQEEEFFEEGLEQEETYEEEDNFEEGEDGYEDEEEDEYFEEDGEEDEDEYLEEEDEDDDELDEFFENSEDSDDDYLNELLSNFGIEDGIISLEDEEGNNFEAHISELDIEDREEIYQQLLTSAAENLNPEPQDIHNLSETELEIITGLRHGDQTLDEVINQKATDLMQERLANTPFLNEDSVSTFSNEEIFQYDYIENMNQEDLDAMSEEELQALLLEETEQAKKSKFFDTKMSNLKNRYLEAEQNKYDAELAEQNKKAQASLEQEQQNFVNQTVGINEIGAFEIDEKIKNEIYNAAFEVNEDGVNKFFSDIMKNPELAFKAIYYALKGEENEREIVDHFQKERKQAIAKAVKNAVDGYPENRIESTKGNRSRKNVRKKSTRKNQNGNNDRFDRTQQYINNMDELESTDSIYEQFD